MTTYPSAPVDQQTADTLGLIAADRVHRTDRQIILDAIQTVAARNGGDVDPNELRAEVTGLVQPNTIGAVIQGLAKRGVLVCTGWTVTQGSTSGNSGKPCRTYRLTDPRVASPGAGRPRGPRGPAAESRMGSAVDEPEHGSATPAGPLAPSVISPS